MKETKINIMIFGQLEDVTGTAVVSIDNVSDTEILLQKLYAQYPLLKEKKFLVALDKKIITQKTAITKQTTIALLPPFSGG
jgi:sulfur-carrier protein